MMAGGIVNQLLPSPTDRSFSTVCTNRLNGQKDQGPQTVLATLTLFNSTPSFFSA